MDPLATFASRIRIILRVIDDFCDPMAQTYSSASVPVDRTECQIA